MNEKNNIKNWYDAINGIFGNRGIPERYRWREQKDIVRVLNIIGKPEISIAYKPNGQSSNFLGASANESIELILEKDAKKVTEKISPVEKSVQNYILPGSLLLGHFNDNGAFTYFRLETDKGPYAFFAKNSPLLKYEIVPEKYAISESRDEFREFIENLKKNY